MQPMADFEKDFAPLFKSFWLGGFEGACHINGSGIRLDMIASTQHDVQVREDYERLREFGIYSVRESVRWHLIERGGHSDFSSLAPIVKAANDLGIEVSWTLCHYGWPEDVDIFSPQFITRFERYCGDVARFISDHSNAVPYYMPINEISFFSWAVCHTGIMFPYTKHGKGRDRQLKEQLVRAAIHGAEAIWAVDPRARIVHVDPIIHIIPPADRPDLEEPARALRNAQFEAWDMLAGKVAPELGGAPKYLDIIGVNYYHSNQWEYLTNDRLHWHLNDPRRMPLSEILAEVYARYRHPLFIAETSHIGVGRGQWVKEIAEEVCKARVSGVPIQGICLYPIIDRHDWENFHHWHNSGLWDYVHEPDGRYRRVLDVPYATDLRTAQAMLHEEDVCGPLTTKRL